jgi:hypothetical protein
LKDGGLAERLKAAADAGCKKRGVKGWRPTLVLEITQSGDKDLIKNACNLLKLITHDKALCHGILVLSSSFAVAELPEDEDRQRFLRVGTFSRDEASAHLEANLKANLPVEVATVAAVAAVKRAHPAARHAPQETRWPHRSGAWQRERGGLAGACEDVGERV